MQSTFERVRAAVAEALYIEPETISENSRLIADLGMESIDFLDVMFRLEKEFGISVPRGEIERQARGDLSEAEFAVDGVLTPVAVERLKEMMPEVPPETFASALRVRDIPSLFTVKSFVSIVERQLQMAAPGAPVAPEAAVETAL
jgi:acyl carrier protein